MGLVGFLEQAGRDPTFMRDKCPDSAWSLEISDAERQALRNGDAAGLRAALGARPVMAMHIIAPDGDETKEAPGEQEPDPRDPQQPVRPDERRV